MQTVHVLRSLTALRVHAAGSRAGGEKRCPQRMQVLFDQRAAGKTDLDWGSLKAEQCSKSLRRFVQRLTDCEKSSLPSSASKPFCFTVRRRTLPSPMFTEVHPERWPEVFPQGRSLRCE